MTARDLVLATVRRSLGVAGTEAPRRAAVAARLAAHPPGVVPARGQLPPAARLDLFARMVEAAAGTVERIAEPARVPAAVAAFLRRHNLPLAVRHGDDPRLAALPWATAALLAGAAFPAPSPLVGEGRGGGSAERARPRLNSSTPSPDPSPQGGGEMEVRRGASDGSDLAAVSHAFGAVAETGTVVLTSGPDNPTTLNFLPDIHIVVVDAADVAGDFESVMGRLRERFGGGSLPRTVNLITGPSRSADIEQTLILGAHGPRKLHVIVTGNP